MKKKHTCQLYELNFAVIDGVIEQFKIFMESNSLIFFTYGFCFPVLFKIFLLISSLLRLFLLELLWH